MMKKIFVTTVLAAGLISCSPIPPSAYYDRGNPESLLETSSEVVNFSIDSPAAVQNITQWINQDQPSRAELICNDGDALCYEVQQALSQFGVSTEHVTGSENSVALIYERTLARECENRYIDNPVNPYNLNHPTFGCSKALNVVQMVSDKRQFTNPALSDYADAEKVAQGIAGYRLAPAFTPVTVDPNFTPISGISSSSDLGGGK